MADSKPNDNALAENKENLGAATYLYEDRDLKVDIINDYPWTISKNKDVLKEVPYIFLTEYEINESIIQSQISYYATAVETALEETENRQDILSPYRKLFPRNPTGNTYRFPYFSDVNFKLETPMWPALDALEAGKKVAEGVGRLAFGATGANAVSTTLDVLGGVTTAALASKYPKVGIMDRPRLWERHDLRSVEVKFHLFNTIGSDDWKKNRAFCWSFVNQNLFRKRDFITGIPPVYYEFIIPGQHYSFAACVTDITIYNRGNMRILFDDFGGKAVVPDVYEINITLSDMVMPSRNLFQYLRKAEQEVQVNSAPSPDPAIARLANEAIERSGNLVRRGLGSFARGVNETTDRVVQGVNNLVGGVQ